MSNDMQRAVAAIKAGDNETGQQFLARVINADPQNEAAWSLLASVVEDEDKKRRCLEQVLAINPGNGRAELELLQLQQAEPSVKPREGESSNLVESVQCPKCGAPVDVTAGRESLHCTYCGAGLKIARGASGHAMATLADIKDDTSLLAMRAALERLEEKLQSCRGELQGLENARSEELTGWEAEQQREEQRQEDRSTRLSTARRRVKSSTNLVMILTLLGVPLLGLFLCPIAALGELEERAMALVVGLPSLIAALFILFRERPQLVKQLESAVQDEGAPGGENTNQKHKERLQRIDVEVDEIRSQIQEIESQRHTLRTKLDGLTDQL